MATSSKVSSPEIKLEKKEPDVRKEIKETNADEERVPVDPEECDTWRNNVLERLHKFQAENDKIPNIMVVGGPGVGKSSFINSMAAAISGEWHEHAYSGLSKSKDEPITLFLEKYRHLGLGKKFRNKVLPDILDLSGIHEGNEVTVEVIRSICYGYIPEGENMMEVIRLGRNGGVRVIQDKYHKMYPNLSVDRVVVVCSANEPIPTALLDCINSASRPRSNDPDYRKAIPIHGILTKYDMVKEEGEEEEEKNEEGYEDREAQFISALSMEGAQHRYATCSNYCHHTAPQRSTKNYPELDLPILKFMYDLLDPAVKVKNPDDNPREYTWLWNFIEKWGLSSPVLIAVFCAILFWIIIAFSRPVVQ